MTEGPQQIAVVGAERGEILEQGERSSIPPSETRDLFVEIECENCSHVGTYGGRLVSEGEQRFRSDHEAECAECGNDLEAVVRMRQDPTGGGLNVEDFQQPRGGSYNHDPYFADKIEGIGG